MDITVLLNYWSWNLIVANGVIFLNLLGAVGVGVVLGYERSFQGRAAGMRTYALVCLASTALVVINGYPSLWYGGHGPASTAPGAGDPTRVIQGIVTGIGFLCAGVIMRDGFSVRGLSTAASIWLCAAIGIMIGVGFYGAAIAATVLTLIIMSVLKHIERALPHQTVMNLTLSFDRATAPSIERLRVELGQYGFDITDWSVHNNSHCEYQLMLHASGKSRTNSLMDHLTTTPSVLEYKLAPARM